MASKWLKIVNGFLIWTTLFPTASPAQNLIERVTHTERHKTAIEAWNACIKHEADFESFMSGRSFCVQPSNYERERYIVHVYVVKEHSDNKSDGTRTITKWF